MNTSNQVEILRNAPTANGTRSICRDVAHAAVDVARVAVLHGAAEERDSIRAHAATVALRLWRGEGSGR